MTRYKGRQSAKVVEQDFPHFVDMVVPLGDLGKRLAVCPQRLWPVGHQGVALSKVFKFGPHVLALLFASFCTELCSHFLISFSGGHRTNS
jgi:hypothetical protein